MTGRMRVPGPDHPITIEPTGARVVARVGGRVVADTAAALTLREASYPPVQYIPLADVDPALLSPTPTTTYCPYKGTATYRTLTVDGVELADALWVYEEPYPAVARIAGHAAFYPDKVDVTVGDRSGGD
ncbi:DUF427 domain-containing protein [Nocardiopsis changdeensis]|uniref:DUF427 domain-containing protein n=1 Tax=Nocardiopsis changdeensis TaxID=2831969 RepID=A0ABX8BSH5_9ACTN|nr:MULTISPECIES: DUF427 domain-containing protein [Nocardiopsis]QUX24738.1 DUF427 domain-containing protein [Nocardiopsis changdeensis]QYX35125.1 DUF427 domain-containing protein [Nocardiopsis sp. MT53]